MLHSLYPSHSDLFDLGKEYLFLKSFVGNVKVQRGLRITDTGLHYSEFGGQGQYHRHHLGG